MKLSVHSVLSMYECTVEGSDLGSQHILVLYLFLVVVQQPTPDQTDAHVLKQKTIGWNLVWTEVKKHVKSVLFSPASSRSTFSGLRSLYTILCWCKCSSPQMI